jgi:hypothetical protein
MHCAITVFPGIGEQLIRWWQWKQRGFVGFAQGALDQMEIVLQNIERFDRGWR